MNQDQEQNSKWTTNANKFNPILIWTPPNNWAENGQKYVPIICADPNQEGGGAFVFGGKFLFFLLL